MLEGNRYSDVRVEYAKASPTDIAIRITATDAGPEPRYAAEATWRDLVLFYEYFDGDTGRGCGAAHQTGWSALVANLLVE